MNRNISHSVLVLVAALAAACSSSEDMTGNGMAADGSSNAPFTILGTPGNGVMNTDASYGEYTAYINVPGKWSVTTAKGLANVYPSSGVGPTTVIVQVGENWGAMRENVLTLTTQGVGRRAAGDSDYKLSIVQAGNPSLESISTQQWMWAEEAIKNADNAKAQAELSNLRNQINPHFLLNTLNNIYALTAFDAPKAQEAIQELSKMLRHILYD